MRQGGAAEWAGRCCVRGDRRTTMVHDNDTRESPAVVTATSEIDARLNKLREDSQGAAGGAKSAFVLLVHPTEPKVLMAKEERRGWSRR